MKPGRSAYAPEIRDAPTEVNTSCPHVSFPPVNVTRTFRVRAAAVPLRRSRPASVFSVEHSVQNL